jgi:hypothetical protein
MDVEPTRKINPTIKLAQNRIELAERESPGILGANNDPIE